MIFHTWANIAVYIHRKKFLWITYFPPISPSPIPDSHLLLLFIYLFPNNIVFLSIDLFSIHILICSLLHSFHIILMPLFCFWFTLVPPAFHVPLSPTEGTCFFSAFTYFMLYLYSPWVRFELFSTSPTLRFSFIQHTQSICHFVFSFFLFAPRGDEDLLHCLPTCMYACFVVLLSNVCVCGPCSSSWQCEEHHPAVWEPHRGARGGGGRRRRPPESLLQQPGRRQHGQVAGCLCVGPGSKPFCKSSLAIVFSLLGVTDGWGVLHRTIS